MTMTGEIARLHDELQRAYDGDCWHGPNLREVLVGISAATAAAKIPPLAHPIWELVNHLAVWDEVVRLRIAERRELAEPDAGDFPPVTDPGEPAWAAALADLDRQHRALLDLVAQLNPSRLDETVPGKDFNVAVMLHGAAQHYAYHAGQIALLKKLTATRDATQA